MIKKIEWIKDRIARVNPENPEMLLPNFGSMKDEKGMIERKKDKGGLIRCTSKLNFP